VTSLKNSLLLPESRADVKYMIAIDDCQGLIGWPETAVTEGVLRGCTRELRWGLGDDAQRPRYIETMYRRCYRFVDALRANC
jgi:hypothetical protein